MGAPHRLRPHACAQAVGDIVGDADGVFFILEFYHRQHGAEHFFLRNAHSIVDAGENGRLDEILAAAFRGRCRSAAKYAFGALALGDIDIAEDLLILRRRSHRSHLGVRF